MLSAYCVPAKGCVFGYLASLTSHFLFATSTEPTYRSTMPSFSASAYCKFSKVIDLVHLLDEATLERTCEIYFYFIFYSFFDVWDFLP